MCVCRVAREIWGLMVLMACLDRQAGLEQRVVMVRCLEAPKAEVVSLDYLEDVVAQADLDFEVCHLFNCHIIIMIIIIPNTVIQKNRPP